MRALGDGLLALRESLGDVEWRRTRVAIMIEFGRTVRKNGTRGTDHGHGGLVLLAGGAVAGGRLIGEFNGLADNVLNEKHDLPVFADWRSLLGNCLKENCGITEAALDTIFPSRPHQRLNI